MQIMLGPFMSSCSTAVDETAITELERINARQWPIKVIVAMGSVAGILSASAQGFGQTVSTMPTPAPDSKEITNVVEIPPKPPDPRLKIYGWIEGGITGNPDSPIDNHNFGQLYTDRANEPLLNQVSIVAERALDPNATGFDWGFKAWFMYGSDARYTKSMGFLDLA